MRNFAALLIVVISCVNIFGQTAKFSEKIDTGSGQFIISGNEVHQKDSISVYCHKPRNFNSNSKILLVIPGAGRNAWVYHDSWINASELYNILILSPSYDRNTYDFASYHLAGIVGSVELRNFKVSKDGKRINIYTLNDSDIIVGTLNLPAIWLFHDFDRIFDNALELFHSNQKKI